MTETRIPPADVASRLLAAALVTVLALPAQAQETAEPPAAVEDSAPAEGEAVAEDEAATEGEAPTGGEAPAEGTATSEAIEDAQQTHIDTLHERLADANEAGWKAIDAQIRAAWSRSGSPSMDLLLRRGTQALEAEDFDTARAHLDDLVRLAPDFAEGWNRRATMYFIRKEYGRSLADLRQVLRLEPRHYSALAGLGMILYEFGDKKGALAALREAKRLHPNLPRLDERIADLAPDVDGRDL